MFELSSNTVVLAVAIVTVLVCEVLIISLIKSCLVKAPKSKLADDGDWSGLIADSKKAQAKKRHKWRWLYRSLMLFGCVLWLTRY